MPVQFVLRTIKGENRQLRGVHHGAVDDLNREIEDDGCVGRVVERLRIIPVGLAADLEGHQRGVDLVFGSQERSDLGRADARQARFPRH